MNVVMNVRDWLKPIVYRRHFRAYCVGVPKSGTHSISRMFAAGHRATHEGRPGPLAEKIFERAAGTLGDDVLVEWLRTRDRRLWLELEAAHPLHYFADLLATTWPDAKFVLTVRDPYSWVNSEINQNLASPDEGVWYELRLHRYAHRNAEFTAGDAALERPGLFPLTAYLQYWNEHNRFVLDSVPAERLMVVPTSKIKERRFEIAEFVGGDPNRLDVGKSHAFARPVKSFDVLTSVDRAYLDEMVAEYCGELHRQWFPHITSVADVG